MLCASPPSLLAFYTYGPNLAWVLCHKINPYYLFQWSCCVCTVLAKKAKRIAAILEWNMHEFPNFINSATHKLYPYLSRTFWWPITIFKFKSSRDQTKKSFGFQFRPCWQLHSPLQTFLQRTGKVLSRDCNHKLIIACFCYSTQCRSCSPIAGICSCKAFVIAPGWDAEPQNFKTHVEEPRQVIY